MRFRRNRTEGVTVVLWRRHINGPIGIDVGARSVRAVQLGDQSDRCVVSAAGAVDLPKNAERDPAHLRAAVGKLLAQHTFSGKRVAVALPASTLQIKNIRLPRMPEEDLVAAGEFEARERFAELGDCFLRILPAGLTGRGGDEQHELIVLAARRDAVEAHLNVFTGLGLTVVALEPGTQAFLRPFTRFLQRADDAEQTHAFVDLGTRGSRIIITRGNQVAFLKMCPVGGEALDRAVAEALAISAEQAANLRRKLLNPDAQQNDQANAIRAAIAPVVDQLGKEIGLCLRYYAVTFRGDRPKDLTAAGGDLRFPDVINRLAESTQLQVNVGAALRGIDDGGKFEPAEIAVGLPEWTTAIGLALREQKPAAKELKVA